MRALARVALNVALLPVSIPLAAGVVVGRAWEVLWPEARGLVSAKAELRRIRKAKAAGAWLATWWTPTPSGGTADE